MADKSFMKNSLKLTEINDLKEDIETCKEWNYEIIKLVKKTVHDLEACQSLLSDTFEEQKKKI